MLKRQCIINIFLLNPKHGTIPATVKKTNSVPAETRTDGDWKGSVGVDECRLQWASNK